MKSLTEEEFSKHIGTQFRPELGEREVNLTLTEVKRYMAEPTDEKGLERFSVFFDGPSDAFLPQQTYHLKHEQMGEFDLFLGAIAQNANGFRYEAVFNYYKKSDE
jgi:Domain of unknown function (DUF6916)